MGTNAREQAALLPPVPGVYRFRDAAGRILYLGRATHLRSRVTSYWGDLGGRAHLYRMVARVARVEAVACDSVPEAAWLERNLLQARLPPWKRAPSGGQESEVWIRLSDSARAPGLTVVYQPLAAPRPDAPPTSRSGTPPGAPPAVQLFGPYLGGRQVRLAVSGLCRVLPLHYAGADMTGTRRDLARIAGVSAADRPVLTATTTAVLGRDPAAVSDLKTRLAERRAAAASILAFELAGRLQQEIEALDWVTAEQKVTRPGRPDADVCGWSEAGLVREHEFGADLLPSRRIPLASGQTVR